MNRPSPPWSATLRGHVSSGVIWSAATKQGLLAYNDRLIMVDSLGSSEAIGMASSTVSASETTKTAAFTIGPNTRVVTDDGHGSSVTPPNSSGSSGSRRAERTTEDRRRPHEPDRVMPA